MRFVYTVNERFDRVNHMLSMIEDIMRDTDHFLLEMHNSMNGNLFFVIDLVLILDNKLLYFDDEDKQ